MPQSPPDRCRFPNCGQNENTASDRDRRHRGIGCARARRARAVSRRGCAAPSLRPSRSDADVHRPSLAGGCWSQARHTPSPRSPPVPGRVEALGRTAGNSSGSGDRLGSIRPPRRAAGLLDRRSAAPPSGRRAPAPRNPASEPAQTRLSPCLPKNSSRRCAIFSRCGSSASSSATNLLYRHLLPCRPPRGAPGPRACRLACRPIGGRSAQSGAFPVAGVVPTAFHVIGSVFDTTGFRLRFLWNRACRGRVPRRRPFAGRSSTSGPARATVLSGVATGVYAVLHGADPPAVPPPDAGRAPASTPACRAPRPTSRPPQNDSPRCHARARRAVHRHQQPVDASEWPPPPRTTRSS